MGGFLWQLLFLGVMLCIRWMLGLYETLEIAKTAWNSKRFWKGLCKLGLVFASLVGLGMVWQYSGVDFSELGITPQTFLTTVLVYYGFQIFGKLKGILQPEKGGGNGTSLTK